MLRKFFSFNVVCARFCQSTNLNQNLTLTTRHFSKTSVKLQSSSDGNSKNLNNPFAEEPKEGTVKSINILDKEERERRLKVLKLEADIANQEGRRVPQLDFFQDHHWEHVLNLNSKSARVKYYAYLWQLERKREAKEIRKQERAEYGIKRKEEIQRENEENKHIIYGLSHTSLFLRIYDSTINHWQNNRLTRAMQFSSKIVLDCSYDEYMNAREASNAAKQLMLCFADNRAHDDPFDLHFCNVNFQSHCIKALKRYIPTMLNPEFPMNVHEECFTKLFPKENLVYLTPHCKTDLHRYNPDDVYIVGAMVDKMNNEPLSLAKAKKLGVRMARLPLDHYLQWGSGSGKSLTLNQMISIMLDLKKTGDWNKALAHVPRRKVVDEKAEFGRQHTALRKRAVHFSMGTSGIPIEHKNPMKPRNNFQFDINKWPASKSKIKQNS